MFVCFSILNSINININFEVILVSERVVKLVIIASNLDEFFHAAHFTVEKGRKQKWCCCAKDTRDYRMNYDAPEGGDGRPPLSSTDTDAA